MNVDVGARRAEAEAVTVASMWERLVGAAPWDELLLWPPDAFALVNRVLEVSESYRFLVSPPDGRVCRGAGTGDRPAAIAREWWRWLDGECPLPIELAEWWRTLLDARAVPISDVAEGRPWELCDALLALNAVADEACAGLGVATAAPSAPGTHFRSAARELYAQTGSLARVSPDELRVLARYRTSGAGISIRSISRHVCVTGPQLEVGWHRILARPAHVETASAVNVVLFPWPLRVDASDFRAVSHSLPGMDARRFGFFEFQPAEKFDLELVDAVLRAAKRDAGDVDMVVLPETALLAEQIAPLEDLLEAHGVWCLITGVRAPSSASGLGRNWVHVGVFQRPVWRHIRQDKHHRWRLDALQIEQYHLGDALSADKEWWEAVAIPRRSLEVVDLGAGVGIAPLVCEDLARLEPVTDVVRWLGPSLVLTLLLDGPQLASRWTARYASVLADDPGSAVCTLTSYGMVQRSCPPGFSRSNVVALWKDPTAGLTEIALEPGAQGILLTCNVTFGSARTGDGRSHRPSVANFTLAGSTSLHVDSTRATPVIPPRRSLAHARLEEIEVSKATSWLESLAEAACLGPEAACAVLHDAIDNTWRDDLRLPRPSSLFEEASRRLLDELHGPPTVDELFATAQRLCAADDDPALMTGTLLTLALEQRLTTEERASSSGRA